MADPQPLSITLPPLQITLNEQQQVSLQWLKETPQLNGHPSPGTLSPSSQLPQQVKLWMAQQKLSNQSDAVIIKYLVDKGLPQAAVQAELQTIVSHPSFQAGHQFAQLLQKLESHFTIEHQLASLSSKFGKIERKSSISREYFLENYYSQNKPVIITNAMHNWQALQLWNPGYLKEKYGQAMVQIQANRNGDPDYELNVERHRETIQFADYIDRVVTGGSTNDYYMVANNQTLEREEFKSLLNDIEIFPEYLNANEKKGRIFFWFGPAGTLTPLHHDPVNLVLAQVAGRKQIKLISPRQTPLLYNHVGVFSKVDCEHPDYEKYPLFKNVNIIECTLEPGEVIFIPVGWWHHVRSLDVSISVSFTNFVFPNHYEWKYPHIYQ